MHSCGHDVHTTCLIGAAYALAADTSWQGKILAVFQPAEEVGKGARAMVADGLFDRFGKPNVVLGQHVAPLPAGVLGVRPGPAFAASDAMKITLYGKGGHGSRPETTQDPVVMAASLVMRLQTIVSHTIAGSDKVIASIERLARAETLAAGSEREPDVTLIESFPVVVNDAEASKVVADSFGTIPGLMVVDPGSVTGSEDVGILALESGAPCVYWLLGEADPSLFAGASSIQEIAAIVGGLPSNHSPHFAPQPDPTLKVGIAALVTAAKTWLA